MNFLSHISAIQVSGIIQSFPYSKYWCSTHQQVEGAVFIVSYFHPLTQDQTPPVVWKPQGSLSVPWSCLRQAGQKLIISSLSDTASNKRQGHSLSSVLFQ